MVLLHCLIDNFFAVACHSEGVLEAGLFAVFAHFISKDQLIELNGAGDGVVKSKIVPILTLYFFLILSS